MTRKRNARAPRPVPAAQDPMDYLLGDVMAATDQIVAELRDMENLQADPLATLAGHCANLGGRVAALAEVVRQMRDQQRGLVVISDPEQPAIRQITEPELVAAQDGQAARTLVRWAHGIGWAGAGVRGSGSGHGCADPRGQSAGSPGRPAGE